jgi:hypothetical protein
MGVLELHTLKFGSDTPSLIGDSNVIEIRMPFMIDCLDDGRVLEWEAIVDSAVATERDDT